MSVEEQDLEKIETVSGPPEAAKKELALAGAGKPSITAKLAPTGGLIPESFEQLYRMANIMSKSGMMPQGLKTPEQVFVAIQMGLEVGLSPMQAVQSIAVINHRPCIWGDAGVGLVRASGLLEDFQEWFEGEGEKLTAKCIVKRKGEPTPGEGSFSITDAKTAKLLPAHPESSWAKYPKRMLQWRARSWPLRDKFADVLKGLKLAEEVIGMAEEKPGVYKVTEEDVKELKIETPVTEKKVELPPPKKRTRKAKPVKEPEKEDKQAPNLPSEALSQTATIEDIPPRSSDWTDEHMNQASQIMDMLVGMGEDTERYIKGQTGQTDIRVLSAKQVDDLYAIVRLRFSTWRGEGK